PPAVAEPVAQLGDLARNRPAVAGPATILAEVLPVLYAEPARETPPALAPEHAAAKLGGGVPLLRGEAGALGGAAFARRWQGICAAVGRHRQGDAARALTRALGAGGLDPAEMVQHVLAGRPEEVHARADALQLDAALTSTVLRWALLPALAALADALAPL